MDQLPEPSTEHTTDTSEGKDPNLSPVKKSRKQRVFDFVKKWIMFFLNPHLLLCFGLAWMITNGWCYLFILFGSIFRIGWMAAVGGGYAALLWLPFTPEKIITVFLAIFFLRLFFPKDEKTLSVLREEMQQIKAVMTSRKEKKKKRKPSDDCQK